MRTRATLLAIAAAIALPATPAAQAPAQTPQQVIRQMGDLLRQLEGMIAPPPPQAPVVDTADKLTAALKAGGPILLAPGTYTGNFVVTRPTTLTGAGQASTIIVPKDQLQPPLAGYAGADDVLVQDLTVRNGAPDRDTVLWGTLDARTEAEQPHRVTMRRVSVLAVNGGHRGIGLHGTDLTLDTVTVTGFWEKGRDSQAVMVCNGPGPYTIVNSVLEASGENFLACGADPGIPGVVPRDITFKNNTVRKPATYRGLGTVKNLLELKSAERVLIEGNAFDGNWRDGQSGNAIVLTVRNQGGKCPQCIVNDVVLRGNTVTGNLDGYAVNILGYDDQAGAVSQQTRKITIDHNLFADSPGGVQVIGGVSEALVVTNNTFAGTRGKFLQWDKVAARGKVMTPLTFARNVVRAGAYGVMGDGSTGPGTPSLLAYATLADWSGNVIEHDATRIVPYPPSTGAPNTLLPAGGLAALLDPRSLKLLSGTAGY
jgi:hypothetical protein